jgi:hypothetical protein
MTLFLPTSKCNASASDDTSILVRKQVDIFFQNAAMDDCGVPCFIEGCLPKYDLSKSNIW